MKSFFVYLLRCADGSYYTGHTDDLERRAAEHAGGVVPEYVKERPPAALVWTQEFATREEAIAAEQRLEGWSRAKKEALIAGDGHQLSALARSRAGLRQAQPEQEVGSEAAARPSTPVGPEAVEGLIAGIRRRDRRALAKSITLLESTRPDHRRRADELLNAILPATGKVLRLGVSGVPGVGKSTFIETLGLFLIDRGHRVAVLAIDPSSSVSGGSILGDKTRMERLSIHPAAYIRPTPASGTLGGVAEKTREAMLVCEAAGYDIVIVETVGVGQSETAVASMTDLFVLLQLPNAGDDLQAIKKGVMEIADLVVVNKADLDPTAAARAQSQIASALHVFSSHGRAGNGLANAQPDVLLLSALKNDGVEAFWQRLEAQVAARRAGGEFERRRHGQALSWMWDLVHARLRSRFADDSRVRAALPRTLEDVAEARVAPSAAARALLDLYERSTPD